MSDLQVRFGSCQSIILEETDGIQIQKTEESPRVNVTFETISKREGQVVLFVNFTATRNVVPLDLTRPSTFFNWYVLLQTNKAIWCAGVSDCPSIYFRVESLSSFQRFEFRYN